MPYRSWFSTILLVSSFISVSISSIYCQTGYNKILSEELKPNERYFPVVAGNDNYFAIAVSTMAEDGLNIIKQSVYVYEKLNNEWKFSQILIPASGSSLLFGHSMTFWGNKLLVTCGDCKSYLKNTNTRSNYVYVYNKSDTWKVINELEFTGTIFSHIQFLQANNFLVVGDAYNIRGKKNAGAAYLFYRSGDVINNRATIQSPDLKEKGHFGQAISATKDDLFISESGALNAPIAGVVYKYDLNNIVNRNVPSEIIRSSDYIGNDGFGLVTSGEDSLLAVSSPYHYRFGGIINGNTEILEYPQVELFKKKNNAYKSLGIIKDPQANQWTFGSHIMFDENKLNIQKKWQPSFYSKGRYYEYQLADNGYTHNQVFRLIAPNSDTTYSLIKGGNSIFAFNFSNDSRSVFVYQKTIQKIISVNHYSKINTSGFEVIHPKKHNVFRVTTDGTESSLFRIGMDKIDTNFVVQIAEDGLSYDTTNYGKFTLYRVEGQAMYFTYKHPYSFTKPFQSKDTLELELRHRRDHRIIPLGIIEVYRPPVLMVHGIWSSAQTFNSMKAALLQSKRYNRFQIFRLDYFFSRAASFETNIHLIPRHITKIKNAFRDSGIVCKEIVVIAHSMGGILLRQYVQSLSYKNDIERFIGLNVPHSGSAMVNYIMESPKLVSILNTIGNRTDGGAIRDLCVDSDQILNKLNNKNQLNKNIIPSHSIVTKTIPHPPFSDPSEKSKRSILTEILNENRIAKIHNQAQNDEVVTIESQSGGLEGDAITLITDEVHTGSTENQKVINSVINLLELPSHSPQYSKSGFKPPRLIYTYGIELVKPMIANTRSSQLPKVLIPDQKTKYSTADKMSFYIYKPLDYNQLNVFIQSPDGNINTISTSKSEDTLYWRSSDKIPGPIKVFITTSTINDPLSFIDSITGLFLIPVDSITSITSDIEKVEADQNEYTPMQVMGTDMHGKSVNLTYANDLRMITKNGLVIWQDGQLLHRSPGTDTIYFQYKDHRSNHTIIHITPATLIPSVSLTRKGPICKSTTEVLQASTILGLKPPYTYLWSTGDTSYKLKNLPAGYYSVLVTDSDSKQAEAGIMLYTGLNPWESTDTVLKAGSILTSSVIPQASYRWSTGDTGTFTTIKSTGAYIIQITTPASCLISDTFNVYTSKPTITVYNHPALTTIKQKDGSWLLAPKNKGYKIESAVLIRNSNIVTEQKWLLRKDPRQVRIYYNNLAVGDFKLEINLSGYGSIKKEVVRTLIRE